MIVGVAAAATGPTEVLVAGAAGLDAGAISMAAGKYVSVSSQTDTEAADLSRERVDLDGKPETERAELAAIYVARGMEPTLAREMVVQMTAKDALGTHLRDELGMSEITTARPIQAALTSAGTFSVGAALPLAMVLLVSSPERCPGWYGGLAGVPRGFSSRLVPRPGAHRLGGQRCG